LVAFRVWVTLARPPREDASAIYVIEARDEVEALRVALIWAASRRHVVMPVRSELLEILEI